MSLVAASSSGIDLFGLFDFRLVPLFCSLVQFLKSPRLESHVVRFHQFILRIKNHADDLSDTFTDVGILSMYNAILNKVSLALGLK